MYIRKKQCESTASGSLKPLATTRNHNVVSALLRSGQTNMYNARARKNGLIRDCAGSGPEYRTEKQDPGHLVSENAREIVDEERREPPASLCLNSNVSIKTHTTSPTRAPVALTNMDRERRAQTHRIQVDRRLQLNKRKALNNQTGSNQY